MRSNLFKNFLYKVNFLKSFIYMTYFFFLVSVGGNYFIPSFIGLIVYIFDFLIYDSQNYTLFDGKFLAVLILILMLTILINGLIFHRVKTEEEYKKEDITSYGSMTNEKWLKSYENFKNKYKLANSKHGLSKLSFLACYILSFIFIIIYPFTYLINFNGFTLLSVFNLIWCGLIKLQKKLEDKWSYPRDRNDIRYENRILIYLVAMYSLFIPFINEWYKYLYEYIDDDFYVFFDNTIYYLNYISKIAGCMFVILFIIPRLKVLIMELKLESIFNVNYLEQFEDKKNVTND